LNNLKIDIMKRLSTLVIAVVMGVAVFAAPPKKVDVAGKCFGSTTTDNPDGSKTFTIICSVVFAQVCYTVEVAPESVANPNTQDGPLPVADHYSNVIVSGLNNYGDYFAHYQHFMLPDLTTREHQLFFYPIFPVAE